MASKTSKSLLEFEKAMKYMDPMQVTDYLQKTLDFLKRNNSEVYFPSISPYVEAFLVNLVSDTRHLKSKSFNYDNRMLAAEIIEVLEMSKQVFRWTHAYENGNLLVYKKMYSDKMKKPIKLSTITNRLIQARASDLRKPHSSNPPQQAPKSPNPTTTDPKHGLTTNFKLGFLDLTLRFVKSTDTELQYQEMPLSQAEYIYNLLKFREKEVGLGFKSLYAKLWEAMEEFGADCDFEVTLKETSRKDMAAIMLEKVPKNSSKSKKDKGSPKTKGSAKNKDEKDQELTKSPRKENKNPNKQTDQSLNSFLDPYADVAALPSLGLLTNITDKFFRKSVVALTEFADNENRKTKTFNQLSDDELGFLEEVQSMAESKTVRDMFMPKYRTLLWKLDRMVQEALKSCDLATTVDMNDRSITWKKTPKSSGAVKKSPDAESSALPPLELLANISEPFFKHTIAALTDFADDESCASRTFTKITKEQIVFVKRIRELAGSPKVRELFDPHYRDLLWRLNYSINEASKNCKITTTVNESEGSITLNKKPRFATPAPVQPAAKTTVATGTRSKSMVAMKTRDRSLSKDRMIQFEKGGVRTVTDVDLPTEKQARGRSMTKRAAKLLEDLSTPLESDIGMRMMLLMGWNGGALGARGDGIMEPVMPKIDWPTRGGLGHVPPVKVIQTPRKPIEFRMMLLHNLLDFLLHDERNKLVQLKEPIVEKERKFLKHLLTSVNGRHRLQLTENENEVLAKIYSRLSDYPTMEIKADISKDLRTVTLLKVFDRPLRALNLKIPKPTAAAAQPAPKKETETQSVPKKETQPQSVPKKETQPQSTPKVDVIISRADVNQILPHIDVTQMEVPASRQAIRKRALRLLFLTKFAEALSWDRDMREHIVFLYEEGVIPKHVVTFMRTIIEHLNKDVWYLNLHGQEWEPYTDLLRLARGSLLALDFKLPSRIILTRTPIIIEDSLHNNFAALKVSDNTDKTDHRSQNVNDNDDTKNIDSHDNETSKELKTTNVVGNIDDLKLNEATDDLKDSASARINEHIEDNVIINSDEHNGLDERNVDIEVIEKCSSEKETMAYIDMDLNNNKDDYMTHKSNENDVILKENRVGKETSDNHKNNETFQIDNLKDIDLDIETGVYSHNSVQFTETKEQDLENKIGPDNTIELNIDNKNDILIKSEEIIKETDSEADNRDIAGLSDLEKDIHNLEMAILNSVDDVTCIKTENNSDVSASDLEMELSDTDLIFDIKQENDDSNISGKRSHSNSICSQELDPKKTKLTESDENLVMIMPKNPDERMTQETIKEVQTIMSKELDKSGGFLPLLKCHGVQNGGLIYSCHDEDDVAWLKKVISDASLDLEIVAKKDLVLDSKSRELLIKINSYVPLDTKKTFRKFEVYNVGLDTKFWKVSFKHTTDTFVMFIVTVDEKSFKYISDEKFSLYCGIDKAQFSIIFKS